MFRESHIPTCIARQGPSSLLLTVVDSHHAFDLPQLFELGLHISPLGLQNQSQFIIELLQTDPPRPSHCGAPPRIRLLGSDDGAGLSAQPLDLAHIALPGAHDLLRQEIAQPTRHIFNRHRRHRLTVVCSDHFLSHRRQAMLHLFEEIGGVLIGRLQRQ